MHPAWLELSAMARGIAALLVLHMTKGELEVFGNDWRVSVCRSLSIDSSERGNVCKALSRVLELGIVRLDSGRLRLEVHPTSAAGPPRVRTDLSMRKLVGTNVAAATSSLNSDLNSSSAEFLNNQTENACAREENQVRETAVEIPFEKTSDASITAWSFIEQVLGPQGGPAGARMHKDTLSAVVAAATQVAGSSDGDRFEQAVRGILARWQADPWVREKGVHLSHLGKNVGRYIERAKVEPADPNPRRTAIWNAKYRERVMALARAGKTDEARALEMEFLREADGHAKAG